MNTSRPYGFTLVEFVIAIVFVGVVLGPFLVFAARLHDLNSAIGQQARREAWRSFADQAVAAGFNPAAPVLTPGLNAGVPDVTPITVSEGASSSSPGEARIVPLRIILEGSVAESRITGSGFQIGAGAPVPPLATAVPPLVPIVMPVPTITPSDGTVIPATSLSPEPPGAPYTTEVRVTSSPGVRVKAVFNQPAASLEGTGSAQYPVTAADLLYQVNGSAWTEYPGDPASGHQAVALADGRTRWLVITAANRVQIYEPSPAIPFAYQIGLGVPVLIHGSTEIAANTVVPFDYAAYLAVRNGTSTLKIDFPDATKRVFGARWPDSAIGFRWTFQAAAGPFSGDASLFFHPDQLPLWSDAVAVSAEPVIPAGATAEVATWTLARIGSPLGVPVLSTGAGSGGFFSAGQVEFSAPPGPDGAPVGRLSFANGETLSTGPTLSMTVIP